MRPWEIPHTPFPGGFRAHPADRKHRSVCFASISGLTYEPISPERPFLNALRGDGKRRQEPGTTSLLTSHNPDTS